jgi:catechol 2,3-dioxygenase
MKIGHLRFKVRELEPAVAFYTEALGMTVNERVGEEYVFLSCSGAHHEIALMKAGTADPSLASGDVGFDHLAFELPDKRSFAEAYFRISKAGIPVAPVDNGISWAMYLADPDGNRIELFCDNRTESGGRALWRGNSDNLDVEVIRSALGA